MQNIVARWTAPVLLIAAASLSPRVVAAQDAPLTIEAVAVSLGGPTMSSGTAQVTLHIDRWSTDDERGKLKDAVVEKGDDALLKALQHTKPVGRLSTNGSLGWDIHYAQRVALPGGGWRISFATDRPMGFAERVRGTRSRDYEYLLGEVRVGADGKGEGKLVPRASVMYDTENNTLTIENYDSLPVRLTNVRLTTDKQASAGQAPSGR
jgi:hypothetical protein